MKSCYINKISGFLAGLLILLIAACQSSQTREDPGDIETGPGDEITLSDEQVKMAEIVSGKLEEKILSDNIRCNGMVEVSPEGLVSISLPMDGYVKKINVHAGSQVKKGELMVIMQHPDYLALQQEYVVTGNNLAMLKEDLTRQETLAENDAASIKKLTAARTNYENALVRHASIEEKMKMMGFKPDIINAGNLNPELGIHSPVNGFVRENHVNTGLLVTAGVPILELEDDSKLQLQLSVYEKEINRVKKGQQVEFKTGSGERNYEAEIYLVGRTMQNENRAAIVLASITNPDKNLLSGMYVKATILAGQTKVFALPESGIAIEGSRRFVFLREGNQFKRIPVETGLSRDGYVEIKDPGSLVDQELVVAGAYYLNAGFGEEE